MKTIFLMHERFFSTLSVKENAQGQQKILNFKPKSKKKSTWSMHLQLFPAAKCCSSLLAESSDHALGGVNVACTRCDSA